MNGKGDKARPMKVSRDRFNEEFDRIFGPNKVMPAPEKKKKAAQNPKSGRPSHWFI